MRLSHFSFIAGGVLVAGVMAGCSGAQPIDKVASTSAISSAEASGASAVPSASLYLQYAREGLEKAKALAADGEKEQAESMLLRAQADAELAEALSRGDSDKQEAVEAIERVRQLRMDNKLPEGRE
jgi:regulator of protease activity HflC (stomatin/prohibitin superfamily)